MESSEAPDPTGPTEPTTSTPFTSTNAHLLSLLGRPALSTTTTNPPDQNEITPATPHIAIRPSPHPHAAPLGLVPDPALESAVNLWLSSHQIPLDELQTAAALCAAVGHPTPRFLRRRLRIFRTTAKYLDVQPDNLPKEEDVRLRRAWPRVLYAVARVAQVLDPDGWGAAVSSSQPQLQLPLPINWRACALDERWQGDWLVREMAVAHARDRCTIVVAGTQGAGKTATVARLLGRVASPEHHALSCIPDESEMEPREREDAAKLRHIRVVTFPIVPVELNAPFGGAAVDRTHVKVDGRMVTFVELPSMEETLDYEDETAMRIFSQFGKFEKVVEDVQGEFVDYVFLVDRLDDLHERRLRKMVTRVKRIYGKRVLEKMLIVLTHGQELPPAGLSYEVWVFDRMRVVSDVLQKVQGEGKPIHVPVVVFENSTNCRRDETSQHPLLADGTDFLRQFLQEFRGVVKRNVSSPSLHPIPTRRWWEKYVIMGCVALFAVRMF